MSRQRIAVLGLGQFGAALARELAQLGAEVLAADASPKLVEAIAADVAHAAVADVRDRAALQELFSRRFDAAVIAIGGSLEAAILATLHLRELGVEEIWVEANQPDRAEVLKRVGATRVVAPERDYGRRVAQQLAHPDLVALLPLEHGYSIVETAAPDWTVGRTLAELALRSSLSLTVISISSAAGRVTIVPGGNVRIAEGDRLTVVGKDEDVARFQESRRP